MYIKPDHFKSLLLWKHTKEIKVLIKKHYTCTDSSLASLCKIIPKIGNMQQCKYQIYPRYLFSTINLKQNESSFAVMIQLMGVYQNKVFIPTQLTCKELFIYICTIPRRVYYFVYWAGRRKIELVRPLYEVEIVAANMHGVA